MNSTSVTLRDVSKTFEDDQQKNVYAVSKVNLFIQEGEFATLLGPSGCGKTTILRMIAGFEEPTEGEILFGTKNINKVAPNKRDCTMVFQSYALFPHMSVWENVAYGLKLKKISKSEIHEKIDKVFDIMNLSDYKYRMPNQLSGGQQQRVALARSLVMEPSLLLFDEPLSNLDAKLRVVMRDEIRRIQKEVGITAIYVTHDQSEAMSMSDKIIVMNNGKIEQVGSPQEIYQTPATSFVADFIGTANFIQGTVIEVNEKEVTIRAKESIFKAKNSNNVVQGESVTLVIRPESIDLDEGMENCATVTKSIFMGQVQEYEVDFMGIKLQVSVSNPAGVKIYQEGDTVSLNFKKSDCHVITTRSS